MGFHATPFQLVSFLLDFVVGHVPRLFRGQMPRTEENVNGKVVVLTGANSGLGKHTAEEMAKRGAIVVMGCRNLDTGKQAQDEIKEKSGSSSVELCRLDLSDMASIHAFTAVVLKAHPVIDVLINNAGISLRDKKRSFTKDGFEVHMGTNHLGHFLLTNLLMESLKRSTLARVVTVSSTGCFTSKLDLDDLMMENASNLGLGNTTPYSNSKFANALFTKELAKRGGNIKAYSICPGLVKTEILRHYPRGMRAVFRATSVSIRKGADTILLCALAKELAQDSGKYFRFGKHLPAMEKLFTDEMAERLWQLSDTLVAAKKP